MFMKLFENEKVKILRSEEVNYNFDKETGFMATWGKTLKDDPDYSPYGPFILDIEVTTICKGPNGKLCEFCYKSNTPNGKNMSFDTFKKIFDKLPKCLSQIAIGADSYATSNPELFDMMKYARDNGVIPNITVADIDDETADKIVEVAGACAISRYNDKDICYNSIKKLTDRGMKQVNMHFCIHKDSLDQAYETLNDIKTDERLKGLNAIVFLSLKQKGRGVDFQGITQEEFSQLVEKCNEMEISYGFDSCGAHRFLNAVKDKENYKQLELMAETCESSIFSAYIDVNGIFFPCSFTEGCDGWEDGIDVLNSNDFLNDVWNNERIKQFREKTIKCKGKCFLYKI